jgi:hypothetical protein
MFKIIETYFHFLSDEILKLGNTYTYLASISKDIGVIKSLTFKWHHTLTLLDKSEIYVESVSVSPMFIMDKA